MAKCRTCKETIDIKDDDFIKLKQKFYYHTDCYINKELEKEIPIAIIQEVVDLAKKEYLEELQKKIKKYKQSNIRDGIKNLTDWIQLAYDIDFLPKMFYIKMSSITNGSYKGLKEPVTYIELLDMLQRRKKQFDIKFAGKKFSNNLQRFYYDLAVVLSQYESYKKWKIVQEIKKKEAIENLELQQRINSNNVPKQKIQHENKDSVEDALNDIFG